MESLRLVVEDGLATITMRNGKVNAINELMLGELETCFRSLEADPAVGAVIWTGQGKFFSFGFDVPALFNYPKKSFSQFAEKFCALCSYLFLYPKPVVGALNGHAIAGGCVLALACDYRVMVSKKAKIGLNAIRFGSSLPACSVEMLRYWAGERNAQLILQTGDLFMAEEGCERHLVEEVCPSERLMEVVRAEALTLAEKNAAVFETIKRQLRRPFAENMARLHRSSVDDWVAHWYSEETRKNLRGIAIHS